MKVECENVGFFFNIFVWHKVHHKNSKEYGANGENGEIRVY